MLGSRRDEVDCENIGPIKTPHNFVNFNYTLYIHEIEMNAVWFFDNF